MNEIRRDRALTTADLAMVEPPAEVKPGPGPAARREYVEEPRPEAGASGGRAPETSPLFSPEETQRFRSEWDSVQIGFVDEPRKSVEKADGLVANVIQRLAEGFSKERSKLESQWGRGEDVSTEDLRIALQRYRSFFDRLLSV
jgi:hypothetical protein